MTLLCNRPHARQVDFNLSRFVVSTVRGLLIGDRKFLRGEEIPKNSLTERALRTLYEPPTHAIETVEFAQTDPGLILDCAKYGVCLEEKKEEKKEPEVVCSFMCEDCGEMFPGPPKEYHSKKECKKNQKKRGLV